MWLLFVVILAWLLCFLWVVGVVVVGVFLVWKLSVLLWLLFGCFVVGVVEIFFYGRCGRC